MILADNSTEKKNPVVKASPEKAGTVAPKEVMNQDLAVNGVAEDEKENAKT